MKSIAVLFFGMFLALPTFADELPSSADEAGFYVQGTSARTAVGAAALLQNLIEKDGDHDVCYRGDFQSALDNVDDSISIAVNDVFGEGEFPALDADVTGADGRSASGIISSCH